MLSSADLDIGVSHRLGEKGHSYPNSAMASFI
jgi:hypothetical protein